MKYRKKYQEIESLQNKTAGEVAETVVFNASKPVMSFAFCAMEVFGTAAGGAVGLCGGVLLQHTSTATNISPLFTAAAGAVTGAVITYPLAKKTLKALQKGVNEAATFASSTAEDLHQTLTSPETRKEVDETINNFISNLNSSSKGPKP